MSDDSLGLHLALALKKKVLGLFGSTNEKEINLYGLGTLMVPDGDFECRPCFKPACIY